MSEKKKIRQEFFTGERALFQGENLKIYDSVFADGESPLKESHDIELYTSLFRWKYPLWYSRNIVAKACTWFAFEYSTVDAEITSKVDSIMNPSGGVICAESIAELIIEKDKVNPQKTKIICKSNAKETACA
jgi:hypothetical protein